MAVSSELDQVSLYSSCAQGPRIIDGAPTPDRGRDEMSSGQDGISPLKDLLDELRDKHGVVGATLGVLKRDAIETVASGLLNLDTKVECTPQSVFQIGSISKIFTTTLIMQLVDEGRLDLDDPVRRHLRDFT